MTTTNVRTKFVFWSWMALSALGLLSCATINREEKPPATTRAAVTAVEKSAPAATVRKPSNNGNDKTSTQTSFGVGCPSSPPLTREERLQVIENAVTAAEREIEENPSALDDWKTRMRLTTFAASRVSEKLPLISIDQSCWGYFFEAKSGLSEGDEEAARLASRNWRICLVATLPDSIPFALPYFSCFDPSFSPGQDLSP